MALLRRGHTVTMLDAGLELESDRKSLVDSLRAMPRENWPNATLSKIKEENMRADTSGVPLKYVFGSDFPYRETARYIPISPGLSHAGALNGLPSCLDNACLSAFAGFAAVRAPTAIA